MTVGYLCLGVTVNTVSGILENCGGLKNTNTMKKYNRVMLGRQSMFAVECIEKGSSESTVVHQDLAATWLTIGESSTPISTYLALYETRQHQNCCRTQCGMTWTLSRDFKLGTVVSVRNQQLPSQSRQLVSLAWR